MQRTLQEDTMSRLCVCIVAAACIACSGESASQQKASAADAGSQLQTDAVVAEAAFDVAEVKAEVPVTEVTTDAILDVGVSDAPDAVDAVDVLDSALEAVSDGFLDAAIETADVELTAVEVVEVVEEVEAVVDTEDADGEDSVEVDVFELPDNQNCTDKCKDEDPCTIDLCDPKTGCYYKPFLCDDTDNNNCTDEECQKGKGCVSVPNADLCDDGNPCTLADTCKFGGCFGTPNPCDDGTACTEDSCSKASGCEHKAVKCLDNDPCTDNACDQKKGCVFPFNTAVCDDKDPCTTADACKLGACTGGAPASCDDGNVCTSDSCESKSGCVNSPKEAKACDDGNSCTIDACDPKLGCVSVGKEGSCSNGSQCTKADICVGGACKAGSACDDKNPCTIDSCKDGVGCQYTEKGPVFTDNFESGSAKPEWVFDPKYWQVGGPAINGKYSMRLAFHEPGKTITLLLKVPPMKSPGKLIFLWVADGWQPKKGVNVTAYAQYPGGGKSAVFGVGSSATIVKDGIDPSAEIVFTVLVEPNAALDTSKFSVRIDDVAIWEPVSCAP